MHQDDRNSLYRIRYATMLILVVLSASAEAQLYKCKSADGKVQFSDTACKSGSASEIIPDRARITPQQQYEAQQRSRQMQDEAAALDHQKASAQEASRAEQRRKEVEDARPAQTAQSASNDAEAVNNCVRDVERRGASQDVKAELIAACRTAGYVQRSTGISGDLVTNCVKGVERSGASEKSKARQLAVCHGGDVPPEPEVVVVNRSADQYTLVIKSCMNGTCKDQFGNSYRRDAAGNLTRHDGRRCWVNGKTLVCN